MDRSACKAIVERELPGLVKTLGLDHWEVFTEYGPLGDSKGTCHRQLAYSRATVAIDPEKFKDGDEDGLLRTLRHELYHAILGPYDLIWHHIRERLNGDQLAGFEQIFDHCCEQTISALERMHSGLTRENPQQAPESCGAGQSRAGETPRGP